MGSRVDRVGQRFGMLTVMGQSSKRGRSGVIWRCKCDCGCEADVSVVNLRSGHTRSCGCLVRLHGMTGTDEHRAWLGMIARCTQPSMEQYHRYGGRGIAVCARWQDFALFYQDMGPRPSSQHSLDRINNDGNYEPGNCRWASLKEQGRNKSDNRRVTYRGREYVISELVERFGVSDSMFRNRLKRGWSVEEAIERESQRG